MKTKKPKLTKEQLEKFAKCSFCPAAANIWGLEWNYCDKCFSNKEKLKFGDLTIITLAEETEAWKTLMLKVKNNEKLTENETEMINSIGVF